MRVESVIGALPSRVFKAYRKEKHAQAFAEKGIIRLGQLQSYQRIEDPARRDGSEGEGSLRVPDQITSIHFNTETFEPVRTSVAPGYLDYQTTFMNSVHLFCLSGEQVDLDYLRSAMGPHVVEVFDTPRFLKSFSNTLAAEPIAHRIVMFAEVFEVAYNKTEIREAGNHLKYLHNSVAQKPRGFASECEWRIAVVTDGIATDIPDAVFLSLVDSASFARLLF